MRDYRVEKGSALAWMSTILRHLALDRLRRARHEPIALPDAALEGEERGFTDNGVLLSGESKALQKCLEELEEEQRRGILLSYFEGLTHQELSVRMKKPLGTVKTWIRRGLEKLRGCLERTHGQRE